MTIITGRNVFQSRSRLSTEIFRSFFSFSKQIPGQYFKIGHYRVHPYFFQFIID
jgi:hypothetical protein